MQPYELLDHTADAKFRAFGLTKEEAFANALRGMVAIVTPPEALGTEAVFHISVRAGRLESLLFDFIDEILFLYDTEKFLPSIAEALTIVERDGKFVLDATLRGECPTKISGNLKAVTYSDMICAEQPDGTWLVQVVIDI
ncbi:TPA: archease [Candidatus Woesearchaeota archaeon]|nr:archease [Candidatus Woesearchaeota archaeon]